MNAHARNLWILTDGKRGHENQSRGLAEALAHRSEWVSHTVELPAHESPAARLGRLRRAFRDRPPPDFLLAAGHATHPFLLWARWRSGARAAVLMKPTLPERLFDCVLIPAHDLPEGAADTKRRIITRGALNRIRADPSRKDGRGLFLIGGPSREHGWDAGTLLDAVKQIVEADPAREWHLTDSRRTPAGFRRDPRLQLPRLQCHPATETPPDWLPEQLLRADVVWVTGDSVSMIYEALTAGARVGVLPAPIRGKPGKLTRALEQLIQGGWVTPLAEATPPQQPAPPPEPLAEADRCATLLMDRFFPEST